MIISTGELDDNVGSATGITLWDMSSILILENLPVLPVPVA